MTVSRKLHRTELQECTIHKNETYPHHIEPAGNHPRRPLLEPQGGSVIAEQLGKTPCVVLAGLHLMHPVRLHEAV
jgi:hypothetical protein